MRRLWGVVLLLVLVGAAPLGAQFWEKKPYTEWSKKDCEKLLRDSPWARPKTLASVVIQRFEERDPLVPGRMTSNPQITYIAQLLSAKPIRQALVRQAQLDPKLEELPREQQAAFEQWQSQLLNSEFEDTVVVLLLYFTNTPGYEPELIRYFQNRRPEELVLDFDLIGKSGRIRPLRVQVGQGGNREIQAVFPRVVDGQPVITPEDKTMALQFTHPTIGLIDSERVYVEFKVKDMIIDGALAY